MEEGNIEGGKEKEEEGFSLKGHKIKRSSMYIFNLSYGSKEWFSVLKVVEKEEEKKLYFSIDIK